MKKFGMLLLTFLVMLAVLSGCSNDTAGTGGDWGDRDANGGGGGGGARARQGTGVLSQIGSALAVHNATSNFQNELEARIATTPLSAFGMLFDALYQGTTTVSFTYEDQWVDHWTGNNLSESVSGSISLISNVPNMDFALRGDVNVDGENFDFSVFLNSNRLAVGSSLIGDYYGINFSTLVDDLTRLARDFGFSMSEIDMVLDVFNEVMEQLDQPVPDANDMYIRLIIDMLTNAEAITNDVEVTVGRETVSARRVEYTFNEAVLFGFLRDYLDMLEGDPEMTAMFDNPFFSEILGSSDEYFREMRGMIRDIEREFSGDITATFYIGGGNRLVYMDISGSLRVMGERMSFSATLDLGADAMDDWRFEASVTTPWATDSLTVIWETREIAGRHVHDIDMTIAHEGNWGNWTDSATLMSDWNPSTGEFIFSFRESGWTEELLRGTFTTSGGTFTLGFSHQETGWDGSWSETFTIEISTSRAANIGNVNFVNIGGLSLGELENMLEEIVYDVLGDILFGGGWDDDWWYYDAWWEDEWWDEGKDGAWEDTFLFQIDGWGYHWYTTADLVWFWDMGDIGHWSWILCEWYGWLTGEEWINLLWAGEYGWDWNW